MTKGDIKDLTFYNELVSALGKDNNTPKQLEFLNGSLARLKDNMSNTAQAAVKAAAPISQGSASCPLTATAS